MSFVPLHLHSLYSPLDGIIKLDKLGPRLKELGMDACALTDHGNVSGTIEFWKEMNKSGVKPLIGIEAYLTTNEDNNLVKVRDNYHIVLLAIDNQGLKNLFWLISNANISNFYYKPRISIKSLEGRTNGLVATSACLGGFIAQQGVFSEEERSFSDPDNKVLLAINQMKELFPNRYYLEIQDQDMWEQQAYNQFLVPLAKRENIPLVITTDAHYLNKEDKSTHQLVMAQQLKKTLEEYESGSEMKYGSGFYIKSSEEMLASAKKLGAEEAYWNTGKIAEMSEVKLNLGKIDMPDFDITKTNDYQAFRNSKENGDLDSCISKFKL